MNENFSQGVKNVIAYSREEALNRGHDQLGTEHLLLGIIREDEGKASALLNSLNIETEELRKKLEIFNPSTRKVINNNKKIPLTKQAERAIKTTFPEAQLFKAKEVNTVHVLLCMLRNSEDPLTKLLHEHNIDYSTVKEEYKIQFQEDFKENPIASANCDEMGKSEENKNQNSKLTKNIFGNLLSFFRGKKKRDY